MENRDLDTLARQAAGLIAEARHVVAFTGAGISTESGIPDFRGPGGIWKSFDPDDFTYQKFVHHRDTRLRWWQLFRERGLSTDIEPNRAHHGIRELDEMGKLDAVITQNIDNLHQKAGVPDGKVLEIHGNIRRTVCLGCGRSYRFEAIRYKLASGEEIPACEHCDGILKPAIVFFGEPLPESVFQEAIRRASYAEVFLIIGSTLIVHPAAEIPLEAVKGGARLIIINLSPTPLDSEADVRIDASAGEAMIRIIGWLKSISGG